MAKILSFILAIMVCLSMVACGDKADNGDAAGTTAGTTAGATDTAGTTAADDEGEDAEVPEGKFCVVAVMMGEYFVDPLELDLVDAVLVFEEDGKGSGTDASEDDFEFEWSIEDGVITLEQDDETITAVYEDGVILISGEEDDSFVIMLLPEGEELPEDIEFTALEDIMNGEDDEDDEGESELEGEYNLAALSVGEYYFDPADFDIGEMTLVLDADGEGTMEADGEEDDIEWSFEDGEIIITDGEDELEAIYEDGIIYVEAEGMYFVFLLDGEKLPSDIEITPYEDAMSDTDCAGEYTGYAMGDMTGYIKLEDLGLSMDIVLEDDGTGEIIVGTDSIDLTWYSLSGTIYMTDAEGDSYTGMLAEGVLILVDEEEVECIFLAEGAEAPDLNYIDPEDLIED